MSKTAVSTLQEYMAKGAHGLPEYVIVAEKNGTHLASFTYRVRCGDLSALGTASCKKEAKHNAAREMLKLLSQGNNTPQRSPIKSSLSPQKTSPVNSYYAPNSSGILHDDIFVNSVGKLLEHCTIHKLMPPIFSVSHSSGPPHRMVFTITCSIGPLTASGTASTKKDAKHDAAQNMYQLLIKTTTSKTHSDLRLPHQSKIFEKVEKEMKTLHVSELKMPELSMPPSKSGERAKELFPKLRYRDSVHIVQNMRVDDYHEALKKSVTTETRKIAQQKIRLSPIGGKEMVLNKVLEVMNLKLECTTAVKLYGECVVRCTVNSSPVITDLGFGKTIAEAKEQAMENLLNSINLLLA